MVEKQHCTPEGVCSLNSSKDSAGRTERGQEYGSGCSRPNRLINEKSPYLLQHAYNPVDWYPWGEEAFARARELNLPILLSSGYSSCFWCHQLAHESFEDQEAADVLNRNFICIKVDREERPDIDTVYMMVCQAVTGGGGWPLTIFMTPDQKPFYAGTYFPKRGTKGRPGLLDIAEIISDVWKTNPKQLVDSADEIIAAVTNSINKGRDKMTLSNVPVIKAKRLFEETYDEEWGGFGRSPKFPTPHNLIYLMEFYQQEDNDRALEMAENTLIRMYRGGIYDHIGGGFARYSTDEKWLAPHFEKMLYDNALLILAYLKAYKITNKVIYKRIVEETIEYVRREMTDEMGGFYAAQDASTDGEEGKFYVFTPEEISQVLGNDAGYFCMWFDLTEKGNFEGKSIPNLITNHKYDEKERTLDEMRAKIYEYRKNRFSLHKDDKVLTAWNGLMIAAMAAAGRVLNDERYLDMAVKAAAFIEDKLVGPDGSLKVRYRDGESAFEGTLDEYAYYIFGLLELYETATDRPEADQYKDRAIELARYVIEHFWDEEYKGFYLTGKDSEKLIFRPKESYDGAMPSGNSVMALNLQKLSRLMGKGQNGDIVRLKEYTEEQLEFLTAESINYPAGFSCAMTALMKYLKNSN